ncbi:ubiquitin C-terminal hydrolase, putative [Talaromyces stipitatus ATCC 10500]|uniref:Ubiquitin carboxyl-terminal hydrolase n=1 Tax=Talaromyces stipitatus (strain ATCC 10500 / CBS 375.48 / QM 6759 / NRRL 1006) TaxID=441959 RepID=B8M549_TALSN|nr:ubiquitin C-terminal hydrolase, putative [Talaromyces stipitatus ATCC 10500]EED19655.1 ubiquitin C-terminal hydrolase, putative [Talaromyces stipitatus ATCC 10500]
MPDKPGTVAAYAAGASLAAITDRKKGVVGLSNPANDCFINSVLQALAGLGQLRVYLIRELHRRELDGPDVYNQLPGPDEVAGKRGLPPDRLRELQQGTVTLALKEMLDRLNERPIYKKTISARSFIQALEFAFRTRISRNQQDAQEFLQIVAERLCDEYHAAVKARQRAQRAAVAETEAPSIAEEAESSGKSGEVSVRIHDGSKHGLPAIIDDKLKEIDNGYGFPLEGQLESQIECQTCHYQYRPNRTSFVNLTLQVPQKSSATLSSCFDGLLKTEYIDDFRCDRCGLQHALEAKIVAKTKARSADEVEKLDAEIRQIQQALETDPEQALDGVDLPAAELAPKRRIARHMRITVFPKVVAIHLSRSIFDQSSSTKNAAKVSFPERLPLGGILNRKWYKLLGIVCHKGSHNSGHYESFRRSHLYPPFSTPDAFRSYAASRTGSENPSVAGSPRLPAMKKSGYSPSGVEPSPLSISPVDSSLSLSSTNPNNTPSSTSTPSTAQTATTTTTTTSSSSSSSSSSSASSQETANPPRSLQNRQSLDVSSTERQNQDLPRRSSSVRLGTPKLNTTTSSSSSGGLSAQRLLRSRRKTADRWWRISDDKVKECKTSDVLGMQKEVYLLFYEMETQSPTSMSSQV